MSLKTQIAFIIVMFCFISLASASDFQVEAKAQLTACIGDIIANQITVQNTGSIDTFYLTQEGIPISWNTLYPSQLILDSAEIDKAVNFVNAPFGEYVLKTTIRSSTHTKMVTQKLKIDTCSDFEVSIPAVSQGCNCSTFVYRFNITNKGTAYDQYRIIIDEFSQYTAASMNPVFVDAGKTQEAFVYIRPACEITGNHTASLRVTSAKSAQYVDIPLQLNIQQCGEATQSKLQLGSILLMCALILLVVLLFIILVTRPHEKSYYTPLQIKEPEIAKQAKIAAPKKLLLILALIVLFAILVFLSYKTYQEFTIMFPNNQTAVNQTVPVNITVNQTINGTDQNVSYLPDLGFMSVYSTYILLGFFALLLVIVLKLGYTFMKKNSITQAVKRYFKPLMAIVLIIILLAVCYYYKAAIFEVGMRLLDFSIMYASYILLGIGLLLLLILLMNRIRK
ncbi:MAG: hypothetical protein ABIG95_06300 [Candidatus Woesearchaeota archaeon]